MIIRNTRVIPIYIGTRQQSTSEKLYLERKDITLSLYLSFSLFCISSSSSLSLSHFHSTSLSSSHLLPVSPLPSLSFSLLPHSPLSLKDKPSPRVTQTCRAKRPENLHESQRRGTQAPRWTTLSRMRHSEAVPFGGNRRQWTRQHTRFDVFLRSRVRHPPPPQCVTSGEGDRRRLFTWRMRASGEIQGQVE